MAEPLKNQLPLETAHKIAAMITPVYPDFNAADFIRDVAADYEALELMQRAHHLCDCLKSHLPKAYDKSVSILVASLGPKLDQTDYFGYSPFIYLPHVFFVGKYGLDHFDLSMNAQRELTQRFTAEFSIRPYLEQHPEKTLAQLALWAKDANPHVRRLASEGTRPRLPWAPRLRQFQRDPTPIIPILELLKDDPELYVRRSVANNLNDIGKDNLETLLALCERWMINASSERQWIVKQGLRSAVKAGNPKALQILGYTGKPTLQPSHITLKHDQVGLGDYQEIKLTLTNDSDTAGSWVIDLKVHYPKANNKTNSKVFKLKNLTLAPGEAASLTKTLSFAPMTTRTFYPGPHRLELLINGVSFDLPSFHVCS